MTQEDKELLLKDLCARLPYGVKVQVTQVPIGLSKDETLTYNRMYSLDESDEYITIKPYLRPMSSMTDEELVEFLGIRGMNLNSEGLKTFREGQTAIVSTLPSYSRHMDWLNAHHFDFRGLIERGLAIEVKEKNNPYK